MTNIIDILIKAQWLGGAALHGTEGDLRKLENSAAQTSVEMAVMKEKASALNFELSNLAREVATGNLTIEEATEKYEAAAETLGLVGEAAPAAEAGFSSLIKSVGVATVAIGAAYIAAKKLYGFIKEGAELELVKGRFDRLAMSIGSTGDALRDDLGVATQGLITDSESMAIATDLMAQGLANDRDEAVRLTAIVVQLGLNTNQLMNTLAEQTTSGFDAMGISADGFETKLRKLEDAGHDTDEAFRLAFAEQAEEQIERIGNKAVTTAGQLEIVEARWRSFVESTKQSVSGLFAESDAFILAGAQTLTQAELAVLKLRQASGDIEKQNEIMEHFVELLNQIERQAQVNVFARYDLGDVDTAFIELLATMALTEDSFDSMGKNLEELGFDVDDNRIKVGRFEASWDDIRDAWERLKIEEFQAQVAALGRETGDTGEDMAKLKEQVEAIEFDKMLDDVGMTSDEFVRLAYNMGGIAPATEHLEKLQEIFTSLTPISDEFTASLERQDRKLAQLGATAYDFMPAEEYREARLDFWLDFQTDMDNVTIKEGEKREGAEQRYEERRTDIVERHGLRRAQGEEDFMRGRARSEAKHLASIEDIREDDTDRQLELRDSANQRLSDLERDHIARMAEIVENADIQLTEAAGRLDAAAVVSLTRQRDDALQDERDSYERSRSDIQRQLDEQLRAERETAEERIIEMTEFHEERKRQEDEDRQIRLDRSEDAYQEQLGALDDKHKQELIDIYNQASIERYQKEVQYQQDYTQLDDSYRGRSILHDEWMAKILKKEEDWWTSRLGLVGGGAEGSPDLPSQFFGGMGPSVGDISIIINGAESPQESGDAVRQELEKLFGSFGDRPGV